MPEKPFTNKQIVDTIGELKSIPVNGKIKQKFV